MAHEEAGNIAWLHWPWLLATRATQVWTVSDGHSEHVVVGVALRCLHPTLHGDASASWFSQGVSDPLAVNYLLQSQACHEQVIYYQQVSTLFPKGNIFFSSCSIHFWTLASHYNYSLFKPVPQRSTDKHSLSCSLPTIKDILDPSTRTRVHLVLGSLVPQLSTCTSKQILPYLHELLFQKPTLSLLLFFPNWQSLESTP